MLTHFSCTRDLYSFIKMRSAMGLLAGPGLVLMVRIARIEKEKGILSRGGNGRGQEHDGVRPEMCRESCSRGHKILIHRRGGQEVTMV
jgi:hypothetical protein